MNSHYSIPEIIIEKLLNAHTVTVFTGAGVSAESNIPTFRGDEGLWVKFKPEELANFDAFINNPKLVWEWYTARKKIISDAKPNPGHLALVELEQFIKEVLIVTQNIDNMHRRAGSTKVYELHGNIERNYCIKCGNHYSDDILLAEDLPPKCPDCKGLVRPDVVWFGESLPEEEWRSSEEAARRSDVFFSLGTSGVVYPAASIPEIARSCDAYMIEINREKTPLSHFMHHTILGETGKVLPLITELLKKQKRGD